MFIFNLLLEASTMAQNLAFAKGSKGGMYAAIAGGTLVDLFTQLLQTWFGGEKKGDDGLVECMEACTKTILDNIDELESHLKLKIDRELEGLHEDDVTAASIWLRDWDAFVRPTDRNPPEQLDDKMIAMMDAQVFDLTGANSNLVNAISFAKRKMTEDYATLPLYLAANMIYLNCIKFFAVLEHRVAVQHYLYPPPGKPKPPKPGKYTDIQVMLNGKIYKGIGEAVTFAAPLVREINKAVLKRQQDADAASLTIKVEPGAGGKYVLNPTVALPDSNIGEVGNVKHGYGVVEKANADLYAVIRNAQHRATAWDKATAEGHLELFSLQEIRMLNTTLWTINKAWQDYHEIVDGKSEKAPPDLAGIYPPEAASPIPDELASIFKDLEPEPETKHADKGNPVYEIKRDPYVERLERRGITPFTW